MASRIIIKIKLWSEIVQKWLQTKKRESYLKKILPKNKWEAKMEINKVQLFQYSFDAAAKVAATVAAEAKAAASAAPAWLNTFFQPHKSLNRWRCWLEAKKREDIKNVKSKKNIGKHCASTRHCWHCWDCWDCFSHWKSVHACCWHKLNSKTCFEKVEHLNLNDSLTNTFEIGKKMFKISDSFEQKLEKDFNKAVLFYFLKSFNLYLFLSVH